jgi:dihydropyrimidinase
MFWKKEPQMAEFDIVIRNGTVVTATETTRCDVGIRGEKVAVLADRLPAAPIEFDASGKLVLPGGIDGHCHIEQMSSSGVVCADDFYSGTVSAAYGGTTTIMPFAAQQRGQSLRQVVKSYHDSAGPKAVIDYSFHLIVSDPTEQVLGQELPGLIEAGYSSLKIYMTYDALRLNDHQILEVLSVAREHGAMVMVHAENHDMIRWITDRLLRGGFSEPRYHAVSHPRIAEQEATQRAISLSELVDVPLLIVHVSSGEAMEQIQRAQRRGLKIFAETCPQYLFLTAKDLDRPGMEGAMFCCSPPPRDACAQKEIWRGLKDGTFEVFSSDHAPYRYDASGKLKAGPKPSFNQIPNGVPGLELRMPLLFSECIDNGRLSLNAFVALTATNAAKLYGLYPKKGTIAVGSDADLAIWDPEVRFSVTHDRLHDNVGYTPYEGRNIHGWPTTVLSRGRVVIDGGALHVDRGRGRFVEQTLSGAAKPLDRTVPEMDERTNFGARL